MQFNELPLHSITVGVEAPEWLEPAPDVVFDHEGGGNVAHHMTSSFVSVQDDCSLRVVMDTMVASGHRHVVVVDCHGRYVGVVSAKVLATSLSTRTVRDRGVGDLVTEPPVHLSPEASMRTAASVMLSYTLDAVGVLAPGGRVAGFLTWSDIVAMVAARERA